MKEYKKLRRWTADEDRVLGSYGETIDGCLMTVEVLALRVDRTEGAIIHRLISIGKLPKKAPRPKREVVERPPITDPSDFPKSYMGQLRLGALPESDTPLTVEEAQQLGDDAFRGAQAAGRLLLSIRNFIYKTAMGHASHLNRKLRTVPVDPHELAAEYTYKLLMSLQAGSFDPSRGTLMTYAGWRMRNFLNQSTIYESRSGRDVSRESSLFSRLTNDGYELIDTLTDERADDPVALLGEQELFEKVRHALDRLSPADQWILRGRFEEGKDHKVLGAELGVSRARAGQLIEKALGNARRELKRCGVEAAVA